jgi:hypothetical protein
MIGGTLGSTSMRRTGRGTWSSGAVLGLAVLSSFLALEGCRRSRSTGTVGSAASASVALAPLAAPSWLVALEVDKFAPAKVAVPLGARRPRPIVVALHGDDDRPEWTCGSYRHASPRSFVLCPSGVAREGGRFGLGSIESTKLELRALLPALKARFGSHAAKGSVVLAALGPSVEQAIDLALEEPSFFARLLLIDGSLSHLSSGVVERFAAAGGRRVFVICSKGSACESDAGERVASLERAGVETKLAKPERGRGLDAEITALVAREWPWFIRDDPRFQ